MQNAVTESRAPINADVRSSGTAASKGMETLSGVARGSLFTITGTGATMLFDRISAEMSGYYLLGVESGPTDKDGKAHPIRVEVARKGAFVRSRRAVRERREPIGRRRRRREAAATAALRSNPLLVSALPLRVATYSLQDPDGKKVQLVIHADVGRDYSTSRVVSLAYVITDKDSRIVDNKSADMRLLPVLSGVPSALQYTVGASLAPGDYTLKLAVAEGDRVGTVEHTFRAGVGPAGPLQVSDLMVGGPLEVGDLLSPTIGYQVTFGVVHGYMEAYGAKTDGADDGVRGRDRRRRRRRSSMSTCRFTQAGDTRAIFTRMMPTRALPPGKYVLRAILSSATARRSRR